MLVNSPSWHMLKPPAGTALNWAHPLAKGLVHAVPFNEGGGAPLCYVTRQQATITNNPGWTSARAAGIVGPVGNFDYTASSRYRFEATRISTRGTLCAWAVVNQLFDGRDGILSYTDSASSDFDKTLTMRYDGGTGWNPAVYVYDGAEKRAMTVANFWSEPHPVHGFFCGTWNGSGLEFYWNGEFQQSVAASGSYDSWSTGPYLNLGHVPGDGGYLGGQIALAYVYDRYLTGAEIRQLALDPFAPWVRPIRKVFVNTAAAPGGLSIPIAAYHYNHHLGTMG